MSVQHRRNPEANPCGAEPYAAPAEFGGDYVEIEEVAAGGFIVVINGHQWGNDPAQFDRGIGCSAQVFATVDEAKAALKAIGETVTHGDYAEAY